MFRPTRDAISANYQAKIWLQANKEQIDVPPLVATTTWKRDTVSLTVVWTDSHYLRCLGETGDMQLQARVQDCPMFLLQEECAVHCSMWM